MSSNRIGQTLMRCRLMADWQEAYEKANGKSAPEIEYDNGWFRIEGAFSAYRRQDILTMTASLRERAAE